MSTKKKSTVKNKVEAKKQKPIVGRPRLPEGEKSEAISITLTPLLLAEIDSYRSALDFPPSRSMVIAQAIEKFLTKK